MKRVVCVVLAAIMLLICGTAAGDSATESILSNLRTFNETYKIMPELMESDEFVMYSYAYYELYLYFSMYDDIKNAESIKEYDNGLLLAASKRLIGGYDTLADVPKEAFQKWIAGEITNAECEAEIMKAVDSVITGLDKAKGGK